jgi:hypothetical protein
MNKLERTLSVYKLLNIKVPSLVRVEFFKPMFEILEKYNKDSLGMMKTVELLTTYSLTNHYQLIDETEWIIEDQNPLVKLTIKRVTTEAVQTYVVYLYKGYWIKEWYKA